MNTHWSKYLKLGIIHFMVYPETLKGEGPIIETLLKIVEDDFFEAVEVSWMKDENVKKQAKEILAASQMAVGFGAQPPLLVNKLDLNSLDDKERQKAVDAVKQCIDDAYFLGAQGLGFLTGPDPGIDKRSAAKQALLDSVKQLCAYAECRGNLKIHLETFDREVDKKCLIGPSLEAREFTKEVKKQYGNFGLMLDLSHFPIQFDTNPEYTQPWKPDNLSNFPIKYETTKEALLNTIGYVTHLHIGNCVFRDKTHPAYGDQHPRFGIEGGENDVEEVREFLAALFEIGYLGGQERPIISFEVKPQHGETSGLVIANAKRTFIRAWNEL